MSKPKTPAQIKNLLRQAIINETINIDAWQGQTNPQVVEMRLMAQGRRDAFSAVLDTMTGIAPYLLNMYAEKK